MKLFCDMVIGAMWLPIALNNLYTDKVGIRKRIICMSLCFLVMSISVRIYVGELAFLWIFPLEAIITYFTFNRSLIQLIKIPLAYLIVVLCNYLSELIFLRASHLSVVEMLEQVPYVYYLYILIMALVWIISFLVGKVIQYTVQFIKNQSHKEVLWIIGGNIILCTLVFLVNGWAARALEYPGIIVEINLIIFSAYALLAVLISSIVLKVVREQQEMENERKQQERLQEYTSQIENMYSSLRSFKHDYINILVAMSGYIEGEDYIGLKEYFNENILPTNQGINRGSFHLEKLSNIKQKALKGLISSKLVYAHELGIDVFIDIMEEIREVPMNLMDLTRIVGIYLDNAVEAANECEKKEIKLNIVREEESVVIIIINTFVPQGVPIGKLEEKSFSTKGENRGIGLFNVKQIVNQYKNVYKTTEIQDDNFIQTLIIQKGKR